MRSLRKKLLSGAFFWMLATLIVISVLTSTFAHYPLSREQRLAVHYTAMGVAALSLLGVGLMMVHRSLGPLRRLRDQLGRVRDGSARVIEGDYPSEVEPLVDDLNALLAGREKAIERAQATAGDLAHGLKTPLAILAQEAERLGSPTIRQQVDRMRRQVDYHLAHARATASAGNAPGLHCNVRESAEALARTMLRLHAERGVTIDVRAAAEHFVRGRREDLDEMLGNLLDNACKWGRTRVAIESRATDASIIITVDDDGAGLDPSKRDAVLQRGVRADEAAPGFGLGLAIVRDLAELYGGTIALEESPLGGVRARLELGTPASSPAGGAASRRQGSETLPGQPPGPRRS
jgi:signal transduction histidine kinase